MSDQKICPTCGTEYPANERFCPRDGTALRSQGGGTDLVGSIIAERYHVLKKLGEGGMGQVYLAEHVKMGRKSAVKVMNPGMVHDADAISRFNREAANASRINHPNVAAIYDFGETPDGLIYLAMEFIEGESLTSLVEKSGALPPARAANIAKQAADGLQVAHDMGIVHRDLKPDNIMIAKNRDGTDLVKVVDFGIAKAAGRRGPEGDQDGARGGHAGVHEPRAARGRQARRPQRHLFARARRVQHAHGQAALPERDGAGVDDHAAHRRRRPLRPPRRCRRHRAGRATDSSSPRCSPRPS